MRKMNLPWLKVCAHLPNAVQQPSIHAAYLDFLKFYFWRNADPGIPILKQAKAEYAKLW
jgi:hypothetical protein